MKIQVGYEFQYSFPQATPLILIVNVHHSRVADLVHPDHMMTNPSVPVRAYRDGFGNWCNRIVAPPGTLRVWAETVVRDTGIADPAVPSAQQVPIESLPEDVLVFLLGSRYCETDRLSETAWSLFSSTPPGWARVQAICDFVHQHITFDYSRADPTKTALGVFEERRGVCRDFAHLALTFCRCMNIPARYCTGYLGDIGVPPVDAPMDFSGWFEAYLGGAWYAFDARHNRPRIGRVLIARGRDAADVAISTTFGPNVLQTFFVKTVEVA